MNLFIDTNIFLSFYHLASDDLEELHKLTVLLEKDEIILWLPSQVQDEFKRNRENKIQDSVKKLEEHKKKPQFPQMCKDYGEYSEIRSLQTEYEQKMSSLIQKVKNDITQQTLKADMRILELFEKARVIHTTPELIEKAKFRMDVRNPPGKDGSLGDAINWEGLLQSLSQGEKLHFIADDKDYYSVLDENKLKDFLIDEWHCKKGSEIVFYRRLSQFFREHFPNIRLAIEAEKEISIRNLIDSRGFPSTHGAISKLLRYTEFNESQVNQLAQAAIDNSQVNWIICDPDVYEFYESLLQLNQHRLEEELKEKLTKLLRRCED